MATVFHTSQEANFKPGGHYYFGSVVFFSEEHYDRFGNAPHIYQAESDHTPKIFRRSRLTALLELI